MPPGASVVLASVEPALIVASAVLALVMIWPAPAIRATACGLAVGCLSAPALEMPGFWLPLVAAAAMAEGPRRLGVIPALVGIGLALTWGLDPSLWPVSVGLAALAALPAAPLDTRPVTVLWLAAILGGIHAWWAGIQVREARFDEAPAVAELYGAAWLAPEIEARLEEGGWVTDETSVRDRGRRIAELGAGRVALRSLGLEPMPTWERAALLNQVGRTMPALLLGALEPPDDAVDGPGTVFERATWTEGGTEVIPVRLAGPVAELVVEARGEFLLGEPRVEVQIAGQTLAIDVPDEGGSWTLPVSLGRGLHRMTVRFENPHENPHGVRALYDLEVSLR